MVNLGAIGGGLAGGAAVSIVINGVDKFSKTFKSASSGLGKLGNVAASVAKGIAVLGVAAAGTAVAIGVSSVKAFATFEQNMASVRKTTGFTKEETIELGKELRKLAAGPLVASANELAEVATVAGQLGIKGTENIAKFSESIIKSALALDLSAEDAATSTAKIANAFNLPISKAENFMSSINELSNTSAASAPEIISALVRVSSSAAPLGFAVQDVSALTASLIAMGEPAERAGTKLRSAFDQMSKKVKESSKLVGMEEQAFRDAFGKAPLKMLLKMIGVIGEIEDPLLRNETAAEIFGTVGASAISKIGTNTEELSRLLEISNKGFEEGISLQQEYDNATDTTAARMQNLKEKADELRLMIGEKLVPILTPLIEKVSEFTEKVMESKAIEGVFDKLATIWETASIFFGDIKDIALELVNSIDWELFKENMNGIWDAIVENKDTIKEAFSNVAESAGKLFNSMNEIWKLIDGKKMITIMSEQFKALSESILEGVNNLQWLVDKLILVKSWIDKIIAKLESSKYGAWLLGKAKEIGGESIKEAGKMTGVSPTSLFPGGSVISTIRDSLKDFEKPASQIAEESKDFYLAEQTPGYSPGGVSVYIENLSGFDIQEVTEVLQDGLSPMVSQ